MHTISACENLNSIFSILMSAFLICANVVNNAFVNTSSGSPINVLTLSLGGFFPVGIPISKTSSTIL